MWEDDALDLGTPGASARREGERRRRNRERTTRQRHPRIGGVLLALRDVPAHERAWELGAQGEEATAAYLKQKCPGAMVLHDRGVPGTRTNIDHIAVCPSGILVIDTKRYKDKSVQVVHPLLGKPKLLVGGSDCTKLVDGLVAQVELVKQLVAYQGVAVSGAFCFVDADLPLLGVPTIRGLPVLGRRGLAKRINRTGPLSPARIHGLATLLAGDLKPA